MGIPIPENGTRDNIPPRPSARAIVCLGCSHTYGYTKNQFTWPALLERLIDRPGYQTHNMARRNYGLKLNIDWYAEFGRKLRPERCIIQIPVFCRQPLPGIQDDIPQNYTMKHGSLSALRERRISIPEYIRTSRDLIDRDVSRLSDFVSLLKSEGVTPGVVLYRTGHGLYPFFRDIVVQHHAKIVEFCERSSVTCCGGDMLSNASFGAKGLLWNETHPNERGNLLIARTVYDRVFCPPHRRRSLLRIAYLELLCRRSIVARKVKTAREKKGDRTPEGGAEGELPGEIYTLW